MRDFQKPGRSPVMALNGICATSHPLGAQVAVETLQRGGNAMDAAIAGAVVLGVAEPAMTGLGGDCFALVSPAGGDEVIAVNGSGRAPAAASAAALRAEGHATVPVASAAAVTVPGAVDALSELSQRWGKLGLEDNFSAAIRYMEDGVPVAPRVAFDWNRAHDRLQGAGRRHFLNGAEIPRTGDIFRLPGQADVLRRIARDGAKAFYEGEVAQDMVAALRGCGGTHTEEDFAAAIGGTDIGDPLSGSYKGRELLEHPPNGQGVTAHLLLNILSHFDLPAMDPYGAERAHIEAEAAKLAYDARNRFLADPDHMTRLDHLRSPATAERLAELIDPKRAMAVPAALADNVHRETIYLTVVDRDRMAVSLICSIFNSFGSGIASDRFGILFQNRGSSFTLAEGHPNALAGGKRPLHTIIPAMVRDAGRVTMPFGVMGGHYQPNGHARVLSNMTDFGMDPQAALDAPRSFADGGVLKLERGYAQEVFADLAERGHDVTVPDAPIGGAQAIWIRENGVLEGASDPRKDGCAIGY